MDVGGIVNSFTSSLGMSASLLFFPACLFASFPSGCEIEIPGAVREPLRRPWGVSNNIMYAWRTFHDLGAPICAVLLTCNWRPKVTSILLRGQIAQCIV